jgi:hypothetical protein
MQERKIKDVLRFNREGGTMAYDERAIMAANNNADIYEAMFRSRGLHYERLPYAFVGKDMPPPYYSNLTVLSENYLSEILLLLRSIARKFNGAVGFKDSFCEFDLRDNGFDLLFDASWIWKPAANPPKTNWVRVENSLDLEQWEHAWGRSGSPTQIRMFSDTMMQRPDIVFFGKRIAGSFVAGCIANASSDCVGISNVFSLPPSVDTFHEATAAVSSISHGLPIVGYASGPALDSARRVGFEATGDLRILVAKNAQF